MKISKMSRAQQGKVVKAAVYVGVSAVISYLLSLLANNPDAFGFLTPCVNVLLVTIKQLVTEPGSDEETEVR